jgi:hypothetical protein
MNLLPAGFLCCLLQGVTKFIALFVYLGAQQEASFALMRTAIEGLPVSSAMLTQFSPLHPWDTLDEAVRLDLGAEWWAETGLPFAFAVWQVAGGTTEALARLHELLLESRAYGWEFRIPLAARYAQRFAMSPAALAAYWSELAYELDEEMVEGLLTFYRLAAELGEIPAAPSLRWSV